MRLCTSQTGPDQSSLTRETDWVSALRFLLRDPSLLE
jgi:hypothetical protein